MGENVHIISNASQESVMTQQMHVKELNKARHAMTMSNVIGTWHADQVSSGLMRHNAYQWAMLIPDVKPTMTVNQETFAGEST